MISISLSTSKDPRDHVHFKPWNTSGIESLADIILNCSWSPSVFKNNYRLKSNFMRADWLALDFDDGWPLTSAIGTCRAHDLTHIIGTSKSHGIEKHGGDAWDRFRVVLKLDRTITTNEEFVATWFSAWRMFSRRSDKAAKDSSRFFYPCRKIVSMGEDKCLSVSLAQKKEILQNVLIKKSTPAAISKILQGVRKTGERNTTVYRVAYMLAAAGWSEDDAVERIIMEGCTLERAEIIRAVRNGMNSINRGRTHD